MSRRSVPVSALPAELRARLAKPRRLTDAQKFIERENKAFRQREFFKALDAAKLPRPEIEWRFHPSRKWAFDYAWPNEKVALEVEGGAFTGGRHTRGKGFVADLAKYSEAAIRGWCLIRVTPDQLHQRSGEQLIRRALDSRKAS